MYTAILAHEITTVYLKILRFWPPNWKPFRTCYKRWRIAVAGHTSWLGWRSILLWEEDVVPMKELQITSFLQSFFVGVWLIVGYVSSIRDSPKCVTYCGWVSRSAFSRPTWPALWTHRHSSSQRRWKNDAVRSAFWSLADSRWQNKTRRRSLTFVDYIGNSSW